MTNAICHIIWNMPQDIVLGGITVHLYSLFFSLGILLGGLVVIRLIGGRNIPQSYLLYAFVGTVVGARLTHCLLYEPNYFLSHPAEILFPFVSTSNGFKYAGFSGLASHGGAFGATIALYIFSKRNGINFVEMLDIFAIATPLVGGFIRLGNLMNSEILGKSYDSAISFVFVRVDDISRHPVQIYEALGYFSLFIIMMFFYKKIRAYQYFFRGVFVGISFVVIGLFRIFVEFFKEPQESYILSQSFNIGQLLSVPFVLIGLAFLVNGLFFYDKK